MDFKNKNHIIIAIVALIAVISAVVTYFVFINNSDSSTEDTKDTQTQIGDTRYLNWTNETDFAAQSSQQRWLFFHAGWCPQCRALENNIKANLANIPNDVLIYKVDYDSSDDLKEKHGVFRQTTLVSVDENGDKIKLFIAEGSETLAQLVEELHIESNATGGLENSVDGNSSTPVDTNDSGSSAPVDTNEGVDEIEKKETPSSDDSSSDQNTTSTDADEQTAPLKNRYLNWTNETDFAAQSSQQRWLFFHAGWCPQCRALENNIKANLANIPNDVLIYKVDYDSRDDLKEKHGVFRQTTFVSVDENGDKIKLFIADGSETLQELIEALN